MRSHACIAAGVRGTWLAVIAMVCAAGIQARGDAFFVPPEAPFVMAPDERVVSVTVGPGPVSEAQEAFDRARDQDPSAIIVAMVSGTLHVSDAPLRLASRTCLLLPEGSAIAAAEGCTAEALVLVENAQLVSVSSGQAGRGAMDGGLRVADGIRVRNSGRVNIDDLRLSDCLQTGIAYAGRGGDTYCDAGSVTRCRIDGCGGNGVRVTDVAQFVCVDNHVVGCRRAGIDINSVNSVAAGNKCAANEVGILQRSTDGVVSRNRLEGNRVGVELAGESALNLVSLNRIEGNAVGVVVAGEKNSIYGNELRNVRQAQVAGAGNLLVCNRGLGPAEALVAGNIYFNPPTAANPHSDAVIASGMGRHDIQVDASALSQEGPADLSAVQAAIDKARREKPDDIIVARLRGNFVATGAGTGLRIPSGVCVVLSGSITCSSDGLDHTKSEHGRDTQLILMAERGFASFSGGILDGRHQPFHVINVPGKNVAVIDGVTVKASGFNGITTKHHGGSGQPLYIRGCTVVNSLNRGIWAHVARDVHVMQNVCAGNISDGIDLDAYCKQSTALFNVCAGNRRSGIFVEEGVDHDIVFGNVLTGNGTGLLVYNHSVQGNTGPNVMACNRSERNTMGMSIRGRTAQNTAHGNFSFNNVLCNNTAFGIRFGHPHSRDNYVTQSVLGGNATEVDYVADAPLEGFFASSGRRWGRERAGH